MKLLTTTIFLIVTYIFFYLLIENVGIKKFDYRGSIHASVNYILENSKPGDLKTVILGDSAIQSGLIPKIISPKTYNFSNYSADPRLNLHTFNQVVKKNGGPPKCLIMGSFYTYEIRFKDELFFKVHMYHDLYTFEEAQEIFRSSQALGIFPARDMTAAEYYLKVIAAKMRIYGLDFDVLQNSLWPWNNAWSSETYGQNVIKARGFAKSRDMRAKTRDRFYSNKKYFARDFYPEATFDIYVEQLINNAAVMGTKVFYTILPIYLDEDSQKEEKYLDDLENHILEKQKRMGNFKLIRLDPDLTIDDFFNNNHLSLSGARITSQELKKELGSECD